MSFYWVLNTVLNVFAFSIKFKSDNFKDMCIIIQIWYKKTKAQ